MFRVCYTNVSDLAVCQRCPALFGYKVHRHEKDAWLQGIKGRGDYYGSMFHKNIARVFFKVAADSNNRLHAKLGRAISRGEAELEEFFRENIFMPFVEKFSGRYTSGQIMAAAEGVRVLVRAMHDFFLEIPSLRRNPERTMSTIFLEPEQKLQSCYDFRGEGRLIVTGCYDALMFNPDKAEARLFEFKGYAKSDAAVPLSQSLIYAWLIEKYSGIVPSVEIIYLDEEDRKPDIFSPASVRSMIASGLPGLFYAAFSTIILRRLPEMVKNKDFCNKCKFKDECLSDWAGKFRRRGASLINVIVFMMAAIMITAHVFFFSALSSENRALQAETLQRRFQFDRVLNYAIDTISGDITSNDTSPNVAKYDMFSKDYNSSEHNPRLKHELSGDIYVSIHDLNYTLNSFETSKYMDEIQKVDNQIKNAKAIIPTRIFPPMMPEDSGDIRYFLVRVYGTEKTYGERLASDGKKELMYQVLVKRDARKHGSDRAKVLSFQEVWY